MNRKKEIREIFFEDRTHSHCDHTGDGYPTAAVGFLQNIVDDQRSFQFNFSSFF